MLRPRPPVAFGLFSISLGGIGVMLWGIDHNHYAVVIVGGLLSMLGAVLRRGTPDTDRKISDRFQQ
jgi:hypothetical protein